MKKEEKKPNKLPCAETGVCQCITTEEFRQTKKRVKKVSEILEELVTDVEEIKEGHDCIQKDRLIQLENRQDQNTKDIRKDIQDLSLDVRSLMERLDKKKEQNGVTKQEIDHIHREEDDLAKDILLIKDKMKDHEEIIRTISGINERLIKQEERHQALIEAIQGKKEADKEKQGVWEEKKGTIFKIILIILTIISTLYAVLKDVIK